MCKIIPDVEQVLSPLHVHGAKLQHLTLLCEWARGTFIWAMRRMWTQMLTLRTNSLKMERITIVKRASRNYTRRFYSCFNKVERMS